MRQLLGALIALLPGYDFEERTTIEKRALASILSTLLAQSDQGKVKASFQVLAIFFSKQVVNLGSFVDYLLDFNGQPPILHADSNSRHLALQAFTRKLFDWVQYQDSAPAAGQAICILLQRIEEAGSKGDAIGDSSKRPPFWVEPLLASLKDHPESMINLRYHVFPNLFAMDIQDYIHFLDHIGLQKTFDVVRIETENRNRENSFLKDLLYAALQVGKEAGFVLDVCEHNPLLLIFSSLMEPASAQFPNIQIQDKTVYIPDTAFSRLIQSNDGTVRLAGLSLVVSSHSITRPFTKGGLRCLKSSFSPLFFETDANIRGEVLVLVQRMLDRLKAATATLEKTLARNKGQPEKSRGEREVRKPVSYIDQASVIFYHREFLAWFIRFLRAQTHPAAAYQRHITALKALVLVATSGLDGDIDRTHLSKQGLGENKWSFHTTIFSSWLRRSLYELVMNPFDDVRNFAALLLKMAPGTACENTLRPNVPQNSAAASSSKYGEADTYIFRFLQRAEERMLRSGRADHADGVSRTYALLFETTHMNPPDQTLENGSPVWWYTKLGIVCHLVEQLEVTIHTANTNLSLAVSKFPMHGILASLRLVS
jgi:hypothetical protein